MTGRVFTSPNGLKIIIDQVDGFGKNPGLWIKSIAEENTRIKLASFGSEEKAMMFVHYLAAFCGVKYEP